MEHIFPKQIQRHYEKLIQNGYEAFFVGGSTRDILLKREVKDYDIATNATPTQILELFPDGFYDNTYGTVGVPFEEGEKKYIAEITTYRSEGIYQDHRHPKDVTWGTSINQDLKRRDFTVNAIAAKLENGKLQLTDPFNGQKDIEHKIIRAVGVPLERFEEDALRLIRGIRLATQLGFEIEEKTLSAITHHAPLLASIAQERIKEELQKILESEHAYDGIMLLKNTNLLEVILPELLLGVNVSQVRPGRHHTTDVFTHNMLSLKFCPSNNWLVKFAALIHDIGKPKVASVDQEGFIIFHNHEIVGAKMAEHIAERLRFSNKEKDKVVSLVRWHMFSLEEHSTDAAIRRFIRRVGVEYIQDILDLRIADRLGSGSKEDSWRFSKFRARIEEQLQPAPFSLTDLAINGNDLMKELSLSPSKQIGILLAKLFNEVDEDLSKNTKEYLLKRAKELNAA